MVGRSQQEKARGAEPGQIPSKGNPMVLMRLGSTSRGLGLPYPATQVPFSGSSCDTEVASSVPVRAG